MYLFVFVLFCVSVFVFFCVIVLGFVFVFLRYLLNLDLLGIASSGNASKIWIQVNPSILILTASSLLWSSPGQVRLSWTSSLIFTHRAPPLLPCPGILITLAGMSQRVTRDMTHVISGNGSHLFIFDLWSSSSMLHLKMAGSHLLSLIFNLLPPSDTWKWHTYLMSHTFPSWKFWTSYTG